MLNQCHKLQHKIQVCFYNNQLFYFLLVALKELIDLIFLLYYQKDNPNDIWGGSTIEEVIEAIKKHRADHYTSQYYQHLLERKEYLKQAIETWQTEEERRLPSPHRRRLSGPTLPRRLTERAAGAGWCRRHR